MPLRIALFGTGDFAIPTFRSLMQSPDYDVVGVYTQPDRTGRGHHRHVNQVKALAEEQGIPVLQPERVNTPESLEGLRGLQADVFVVAAYGQILKSEFLAMPPLGAFNLHGSLLPRHRGAAPVQYSVWKGDREAGVTIFQIERALDSGPMIGKVVTEIRHDETSGDLMLRLAELSVELTHKALSELATGTAVFEKQDDSLVTLAPKIGKDDGVIDWSQSARSIDCHVRAMQPWPKAYTWLLAGDRKPLRCILIHVATIEDESTGTAGSILRDAGSVRVQTGNGRLAIETIQPEGKKPMDASGFANGYGLGRDTNFGTPSDS